MIRPLNEKFEGDRMLLVASIKVTSDILRAADHGNVTLFGLLDMSAAFDTFIIPSYWIGWEPLSGSRAPP